MNNMSSIFEMLDMLLILRRYYKYKVELQDLVALLFVLVINCN